MKELTIVYPATVDWYLLYNRPQQLLRAFAKHDGVRSIFITKETFRRLPQPIMELEPDLFVIRQNTSYEHLLRGKKIFWFTFPPMYQQALHPPNFDLVIFDAIDNPVDEFAFWKTHLPKAIEHTDVIISTAQEMYDYHLPSGKPVYMVRNAADYSHFSRAASALPAPADSPRFSQGEKVVGFYGAMASWIDYQLIARIAQAYKVVLIGDNKFFRSKLIHPNVINLPHKEYEMLPEYLAQFDVACIPFRMTKMIQGCDPPKLYEYLAAGKPVVATDMAELRRLGDLVYTMNHLNCVEVIARAIVEDSSERRAARMVYAKDNSWEVRAAEVLDIIRQHLS